MRYIDTSHLIIYDFFISSIKLPGANTNTHTHALCLMQTVNIQG